jgi:hypothetical protein
MEDKAKQDIAQMPSHALIEHASQRLEQGAKLKELKELRDEMVRRGFIHPFAHMARMPGDADKKEIEDIKKHMDYFMRMAVLKKYTLVKTQAMIAGEALRKALARNGYADLIAHMPKNGDYIGELIAHGNGAVKAYKELDGYLSRSGHAEERHYVEVEELGMTYTRKGRTMEEAMAGLPEGAMVKSSGKMKKRFPIIRSKIIRKLLCASVACYVSDLAISQFNSGKIREYNKALLELGIAPFSRLDYADGMETEKRALVEKGYMESDGEAFKTKKEWAEEIYRSRDGMNKWMMRNAAAMLFTPIMKYYLLNGRAQREKGPIFPTLAPMPSEEQAAVFVYLRGLLGIDAYSVIRRKLQFEDVMESRELAAGLLAIYGTGEIASKMTGMKEEEIRKAEASVKAMMQGGKGHEFAAYLGDKGNKKSNS